jgi:hypothetical protein
MKAMIALVTNRFVVTLSYLRECEEFNKWIDEDYSEHIFVCSRRWPLKNVPVVFNESGFPSEVSRDQALAVLKAGGARVVHPAARAPAEAIVVSCGDDLVDYLREFYAPS